MATSGTESYGVSFDLRQPDGQWLRCEKVYKGYAGKRDHGKVRQAFYKEYKKHEVTLIKVWRNISPDYPHSLHGG